MPLLYSLSGDGAMATSLILSQLLPMKKVNYLLIPVFAMAIASCGGKTESESTETAVEETAVVDDNMVIDDAVVEDAPVETAETDNSKIDAFLDDYEAMVNEYDKYVTKLKSGSVDMESVMNIATKAQAMQDKLEDVKSEMTAKQLQRMTKLVSKLSAIAAKVATTDVSDIKSVNGVDLKSLGL